MDAVKFIKERDRMCKSYCDAEQGRCPDECPAYNTQCLEMDGLSANAEELVALVEEWSAAHPRKTRQSVFLEQYPNVVLAKTEPVISIWPCTIDQTVRVEHPCSKYCDECRKEFWTQVVE